MRYHSLENRIECKELRALRPLETVRLLYVRNIRENERENRFKNDRLAPVQDADMDTEWGRGRRHSEQQSPEKL